MAKTTIIPGHCSPQESKVKLDYIIVEKHSEVNFIVDMNVVNTLVLNYSRLLSASDWTDSGFSIKTCQGSARTVMTNNRENPAAVVYTVCDTLSDTVPDS